MTPPGIRRQWRWFRAPGAETSVVREEFDALPVHGRAALIDVMRRWATGDALPREVKKLTGTDLWELRVNVGNDPFRLLFFQDSPVHDIAVLPVYKNQDRLPKRDLATALRRMTAWRSSGS